MLLKFETKLHLFVLGDLRERAPYEHVIDLGVEVCGLDHDVYRFPDHDGHHQANR